MAVSHKHRLYILEKKLCIVNRHSMYYTCLLIYIPFLLLWLVVCAEFGHTVAEVSFRSDFSMFFGLEGHDLVFFWFEFAILCSKR